jgi:hypothetical protein
MTAVPAYLDAIREGGAKVSGWLRPGTPDALSLLNEHLPELAPPGELAALWACFDGIEGPEEATLADLWLDGAFRFYSVGQAINDYRVCYELWAADPAFEDYWPKGFLPIATPGDGSRLLVNCIKDSATHGSVYELLHGSGVTRSSASIGRYFETAKAWLAGGALKVNEAGQLDIDFAAAGQIARGMNPDCDSWGSVAAAEKSGDADAKSSDPKSAE